MKTLVIVSGYFNPIHKGHIEYLNNSKELGDELIVIVNSDLQRELKGSKEFMKEDERLMIVKSLKPVDIAYLAIDQDRSVKKTIERLHEVHAQFFDRVVFANGGDQTQETIPETDVCNRLGIEMVFGLGEKVQSSSWLLANKN